MFFPRFNLYSDKINIFINKYDTILVNIMAHSHIIKGDQYDKENTYQKL